MFERPASGEQAVLVQLDFGEGDYAERLEEFRLLVGSAGASPRAEIRGKRRAPDAATYAGKGKVGEIKEAMTAADADIVMMLRLQRERMTSSLVPSQREYFHFFGLDFDKLARAKPNALVMHPGPMNRGVEIDSNVADDARSVIREQVEMGVAVRMAVLQALARHLPNQ